MPHLACFFKSPAGVEEHNLHRQYQMLETYALRRLGVDVTADGSPDHPDGVSN